MRVKIWVKRKIRRVVFLKKYFFAIIICFFLLITLGIYHFFLLPKIDLNGSKRITIDYEDNYIERGYEASYLGNDVTDLVEVHGKVNSKKIGEYKITYRVGNGFFTRTVTRYIKVVDRKKPVLDIDDSDIYLCPGDQYVPSNVLAIDDYDGDISSNVQCIIDKNKVIYRVSDKSGNFTEVTKKLFYKDIEKPHIDLNGSAYQYIFVGESFVDPGYTVVDNCDKMVQDNVKVEGSVDTGVAGEYTITYSTKDRYGNSAKVLRKVYVSERNKVGTIYLTFDDGPNVGTTDAILDILKKEGIEATFFVTSRGPDELIKREYDEGHSIALHTFSHDYAFLYSSVDNYFSDLYSVQERVKRITGYESNIIRFPGGSSNTVSKKYSLGIMSTLTQEVLNRGFKYYDWNLSSGDAEAGNHSKDEISSNVIKGLRKDRVNMVLMHDIKPYTRDALQDIIQYGKENGYTFEKITMDTAMVRQKVNN